MSEVEHDWTRRVRVGPLVVGALAGTALWVITILAGPQSVTAIAPGSAVVSAAWACGLVAAVLAIRIRVLEEVHLLGPALGFGLSALLLTWGGDLFPQAGAPVDPRVADALELALLGLAAPPLLVLAGVAGRRTPWVASAVLAAAAVVLATTAQPTLAPTSRGALAGLLAATALLAGGAALGWLRHVGRGPGDAEGWVAVGLVLFAALAGLAVRDVAVGTGTVLSLTSVAAVTALMAGGFLWGFAQTLAHRQRIERSLRDRIAEVLLRGYEEPAVDPRHVLAVDAVLRSGRITTVLQPIVELPGGRTVGHEALARFDGLDAEQAFGAATAAGTEVALELLAAEAALSRLPDLPTGHLAINVGPDAVASPAFAALVHRCPAPERVVIELTEHRIGDRDHVRRAFAELRALGVRVAVDDVGAGFAGLRTLAQLSPDVLKLDRALVRACTDDPVSVALVEGLVTFAARTGAVVVAEGVEDAATAQALHALGVAHAQGWHFGHPDRPVAHTAGPPTTAAVQAGAPDAAVPGGPAAVR